MFGKKSPSELRPPPMAKFGSQSFEVLRVWTGPGQTQEVALKTTWKDPGTWGRVLADIARHAANAYANEGHDRAEVLEQICLSMESELSDPTDEPIQI